MTGTATPITVLLADDHEVVRAGIRHFLELSGEIQVVAEADDGEMAKVMITQFRPDVAILDIQMPAASGIEVTRWLRANYHDIGILILTAFDDDPYILAVLQAGANGYLLKTASPAEITQAVRDIHAGKSAVNTAIAQKLVSLITHQPEEKPVEALTDREIQVIILTAKGYTNKAIAFQLGISDRTVQGHLSHIFNKLNATSRTEAVMRAYNMGWVPQSVLDQV